MPETEPNLHRNNAAEWLLWALCWPFAHVARFMHRLRNNPTTSPSAPLNPAPRPAIIPPDINEPRV